MQKYRIAIQKIGIKKAEEFRNVTIIADCDIDEVQERIQDALKVEHGNWLKEFIDRLSAIKKKKQQQTLFESVHWDDYARGKDISREEFLENEIRVELEEAR